MVTVECILNIQVKAIFTCKFTYFKVHWCNVTSQSILVCNLIEEKGCLTKYIIIINGGLKSHTCVWKLLYQVNICEVD